MWLAHGSFVYIIRRNTLPKGSPNKESQRINTKCFRMKVLTNGPTARGSRYPDNTRSNGLIQGSVRKCIYTLI